MKRFEFKAAGSEMYVSGEIDDWFGTSLEQIRSEIDGTEDLKIYLNSPGGSVTEGFAIADMLRIHGQQSDVEIIGTGLVASIATMILAAGTPGKRLMTANGFLMIHNPFTGIWGDADELRATAEILDQMTERLISNYVQVISSNKKLINNSVEETREQVRKWMSKETWFSAQKALEAGLIDGIVDATDYVTEENVEAVEAQMKKFEEPPVAIMNCITNVKNKMAVSNENKTEEITNEDAKTILNKINDFFANLFGSKAENKAENACEKCGGEGCNCNDPKNTENNSENNENNENMTPEEMKKALEAAGYTVAMEEEKEEMTEEEMVKAMEEEGYSISKAENNAKKEEGSESEMEKKFKAMQEELARMKQEKKAQKLNTTKKEPKDEKEAMMDEIFNQNKEMFEGLASNIANQMSL